MPPESRLYRSRSRAAIGLAVGALMVSTLPTWSFKNFKVPSAAVLPLLPGLRRAVPHGRLAVVAAQPLLQRGHRAADHGDVDVQVLGRTHEAAAARHLDEGVDFGPAIHAPDYCCTSKDQLPMAALLLRQGPVSSAP